MTGPAPNTITSVATDEKLKAPNTSGCVMIRTTTTSASTVVAAPHRAGDRTASDPRQCGRAWLHDQVRPPEREGGRRHPARENDQSDEQGQVGHDVREVQKSR